MRTRVIIHLLLLALLACSCGNSRLQKGAEVADKFVEYYYRADYPKAYEYAEPTLGELVMQAHQTIEDAPEDIKEELHHLSSEIEIVQKDLKEGENGEVIVWYDVIIPYSGEIVNHMVTVLFSEERNRWEVVEIR